MKLFMDQKSKQRNTKKITIRELKYISLTFIPKKLIADMFIILSVVLDIIIKQAFTSF